MIRLTLALNFMDAPAAVYFLSSSYHTSYSIFIAVTTSVSTCNVSFSSWTDVRHSGIFSRRCAEVVSYYLLSSCLLYSTSACDLMFCLLHFFIYFCHTGSIHHHHHHPRISWQHKSETKLQGRSGCCKLLVTLECLLCVLWHLCCHRCREQSLTLTVILGCRTQLTGDFFDSSSRASSYSIVVTRSISISISLIFQCVNGTAPGYLSALSCIIFTCHSSYPTFYNWWLRLRRRSRLRLEQASLRNQICYITTCFQTSTENSSFQLCLTLVKWLKFFRFSLKTFIAIM